MLDHTKAVIRKFSTVAGRLTARAVQGISLGVDEAVYVLAPISHIERDGHKVTVQRLKGVIEDLRFDLEACQREKAVKEETIKQLEADLNVERTQHREEESERHRQLFEGAITAAIPELTEFLQDHYPLTFDKPKSDVLDIIRQPLIELKHRRDEEGRHQAPKP